jgi:hypothetical protein
MTKLILYYINILTPLAVLKWLSTNNQITAGLLTFSLLLYALVYRTYIDGKRLADKKIIAKKDIWKLILPGIRAKYFYALYLSKQ